ncbi:MAG: DUF6508 domain-containing protein [Candidatus Sericytochromatia bacterium]
MDSHDIGIQDLDELIARMQAVTGENFEPLRQGAGGGTWPEYDEAVLSFYAAAARDCWTDPDYDPETAAISLADPETIRTAPLERIKTILTYCQRGERFCDGHWAAMIKNGTIRSLLERLEAIRSHWPV